MIYYTLLLTNKTPMRYDVEDVKKIQDKAYKLGYAE
jgi:hypothetical protein